MLYAASQSPQVFLRGKKQTSATCLEPSCLSLSCFHRFYAALVIVELISNDKEPSQVAQEYALALNVVEGLQERTGRCQQGDRDASTSPVICITAPARVTFSLYSNLNHQLLHEIV